MEEPYYEDRLLGIYILSAKSNMLVTEALTLVRSYTC